MPEQHEVSDNTCNAAALRRQNQVQRPACYPHLPAAQREWGFSSDFPVQTLHSSVLCNSHVRALDHMRLRTFVVNQAYHGLLQ